MQRADTNFRFLFRLVSGLFSWVQKIDFVPVKNTNSITSQKRVAILDGFRALAIYWVTLYHYLHRWDHVYPYGASYADSPFYAYGYLGVNLFFIISGFVITLTLSKTSGLLAFLIKRFARLWPPMLICSVITFAFMSTVGGHRAPDLLFFIPSLTFIDPGIWERILGIDSMRWMDGAYWSLWVEVRFYFLAGIIFFLAKNSFLRVWLIFSAMLYALAILGFTDGSNIGFKIIRTAFITEDLAWFTTGICFYYLFNNKETILSNIGIMVSFLFLIATFSDQRPDDESAILISLFISIIFLLFYLFVYKPGFVKIFGSRFFASIGVASYTLYLLHQDIGVALIMKFGWLMNTLGNIFTISLILIGLTFFSRLLNKYWEEPSKRFILRKAL